MFYSPNTQIETLCKRKLCAILPISSLYFFLTPKTLCNVTCSNSVQSPATPVIRHAKTLCNFWRCSAWVFSELNIPSSSPTQIGQNSVQISSTTPHNCVTYSDMCHYNIIFIVHIRPEHLKHFTTLLRRPCPDQREHYRSPMLSAPREAYAAPDQSPDQPRTLAPSGTRSRSSSSTRLVAPAPQAQTPVILASRDVISLL